MNNNNRNTLILKTRMFFVLTTEAISNFEVFPYA